jgi:hypothetical protein
MRISPATSLTKRKIPVRFDQTTTISSTNLLDDIIFNKNVRCALGNLLDITLESAIRHKLADVPDRARMCHAPCDGEAATITRGAIELAKRGDLIALRLCLERLVSPRRERPVNLTLPEISSVDHATKAMAAITMAVAAAELSGRSGRAFAHSRRLCENA